MNPGYYTDSVNNGFTPVAIGNDIGSVKSWLSTNYPNWWLCDGTIPNDAESPIWNTSVLKVPEMTSRRFIVGSQSAGAGQTSNNSKTLSNNHMKSHNHNQGNIGYQARNINHSHNLTSQTYNSSSNHAHATWGWFTGGNYRIYNSAPGAATNRGVSTYLNDTNGMGHFHNRNNTNSYSSHDHDMTVNVSNVGNSEAFETIPLHLTGFFIVRIK
jgi:hypothetical protein